MTDGGRATTHIVRAVATVLPSIKFVKNTSLRIRESFSIAVAVDKASTNTFVYIYIILYTIGKRRKEKTVQFVIHCGDRTRR